MKTLKTLWCDGCNLTITDPRLANVEWIVFRHGRTWAGRDLKILHKKGCLFDKVVERLKDDGLVNWHPLEWALACTSLETLQKLLPLAPKEQVECLATRLGIPRKPKKRSAARPQGPFLLCGACHQPITKDGNLEWVQLPDGTIRDVRMVHKWTCVATRSEEYAKDRGEVRWKPLPKAENLSKEEVACQMASLRGFQGGHTQQG
jgi:hypothetical protein